mgnify:CR=1 FL=1
MLVADDQPNIRRLLEALFLKEGFTVLVAENGQKAVELAATNPIDILISDLIMPDMTGVEVLQKVKSLHPHSTAIIVTAYGTIKSAVEATRCGAYDYLQKPFDNEDIRRIVKRAMEQKNAAPPAPTIAPKMTQTASGNLKMDAVVGGSEKMQEFERCPFGILGLETAIGLSLETFVHSGKITLQKLVGLFTAAPAGILGLDRGTLAIGAAADVTILDPECRWTYDVNKSFSKSRNSPYHNYQFRGGAVATIVNGKIVWKRE